MAISLPFRSPGGTPLKVKPQNAGVPADSDPAAIIAHALQRKFSHSVFRDSPGEQLSKVLSSHYTVMVNVCTLKSMWISWLLSHYWMVICLLNG